MRIQHNCGRARSVSPGRLIGLICCSILLAVGACNQFVGITEPTLLDEGAGGTSGAPSSGGSGGTGGTGGQGLSSSASSNGSGGGSNSSSSSASSSSGGGMPCQKKPDCPADDPCTTWACANAMCVPTYQPMGTPASGTMDGDCKATVCNGAGQTYVSNYDNDKPADDGNLCTIESCSNGMPTTSQAASGTMCATGVCDSNGNCGHCTNGMKDGDETGIDCGGASCKKCNGGPCAAGADCKSSFCTDGVCCDNACTGTCQSCNLAATIGTCTSIPLGQTDATPACNGTMACNGAGACRLRNGENCNNDLDCASGQCTGIPKTCQP